MIMKHHVNFLIYQNDLKVVFIDVEKVSNMMKKTGICMNVL